MKKMICVIVVLLLVGNTQVIRSSEQLKVLVDESRVVSLNEVMKALEELMEEFGLSLTGAGSDWTYSFENTEGTVGFGMVGEKLEEIASLDIRKSGKINYSTLKNYDVLIIASFTEEYSTSEANAIRKFVENGGGLFFLADNSSRNNSVSEKFGVSFPSEGATIRLEKDEGSSDIIYVTDSSEDIYVTDIVSHPLTEGVDKILLSYGIPITRYESGAVLARTGKDLWADESGGSYLEKDEDEKEGPFDILLVQSVGRGRAVFFGGDGSFQNYTVDEPDQQNLVLFVNAIQWLGEPGGPYKQYKKLNEQAQQALSNALSFFENKEFSEAKAEFDKAIRLFSDSDEAYPNSDAKEGVSEAESYLPTCETGIKGDNAFEEATELFENREYENAIKAYEDAKVLYQDIGYTERIQECDTKIQKSTEYITLREEASDFYSKGEAALEKAPSMVSTSGYAKAKSLFEQSKRKWEDYDNPEKVAACEEKIDLCSNEIGRIQRNVILIGGAVVAVVVVVVVTVIKKRKPAIKAPEEPEGENAPEPENEALQALKEQLARGEITKEEYQDQKSALKR
ncbi:MAG: SHOCT domain-containing protein [Theionarchaea archaeon]|nr:SHOCT domain-containing protein [Theionarchaea archaeon]